MNNQSLLFDIKKVNSLISAFDANMPLSDEDILLIIDAAWKEYIPALQSYVILNPLRAIEILKEITKRPNVNVQALRMLGKCYLEKFMVDIIKIILFTYLKNHIVKLNLLRYL